MSTPAPDAPASPDYTRLISLAVHEMRTPASVVGGYLRMLLNDTSTPLEARQRRMVEEAEKSCARLVALLNEFSDLGKLDAGIAAVRTERFDVFALIRDVAANVHEAEDREVRLDLTGLSTGGMLEGDRTRLRSSIEFVMRAVLREQPAATVVIADAQRVSIDGRAHVRLVVAPAPSVGWAADSPVGPFDDQRGGLGLGLPIARRVIARFGGQIWSPVPTDGSERPLGERGAIVLTIPLLE